MIYPVLSNFHYFLWCSAVIPPVKLQAYWWYGSAYKITSANEVMFLKGLSVCVSVCDQHSSKTDWQIWLKFCMRAPFRPRTNFWARSGSQSKSWNRISTGFRIFWRDISMISTLISTKLGMLVTPVCRTHLARLSWRLTRLSGLHAGISTKLGIWVCLACRSHCVCECSSLAEVCTLWAHSSSNLFWFRCCWRAKPRMEL